MNRFLVFSTDAVTYYNYIIAWLNASVMQKCNSLTTNGVLCLSHVRWLCVSLTMIDVPEVSAHDSGAFSPARSERQIRQDCAIDLV